MSSEILYLHPEYTVSAPDWEKWQDLYIGRQTVVNSPKYLIPHAIEEINDALGESAKLRRSRERRTRYFPGVEIIVSIWLSIFFKDKPTISPEVSELLKDGGAENNIDGQGTKLVRFCKDKLAADYLKFGKAILLVTAPNKTFQSKGEQREEGARPYFRAIHPLNFTDWSFAGDNGERLSLDMARHEYQIVEPRKRANQQPALTLYSDEYYKDGANVKVNRYKQAESEKGEQLKTDKARAYASNATWEMVSNSPIDTELSNIPISILEDESWIKDVAEETLNYHNARSNRDNILHNQGYRRIWFAGVDGSNAEAVKMASESVIGFFKNPNVNLLQIEPVSTASYEIAMEQSMNNIFKIGLNQLRILPSDSKSIQASETISSEKEATYDQVTSTMEDIEAIVEDGLRNYAAYQNKKDFKGTFEFNKKISNKDFDQFVRVFQAFQNVFARYPQITAEAAKKAVQEMHLGDEAEAIALEALNKLPPENNTNNQNDPISDALNGR